MSMPVHSQQRKTNSINSRKIVLTVALSVILPPAGFCLTSLFNLSTNLHLNFQSTYVHATSIPWIENEAGCKRTHRTWHQGKCWDSEHNHLF
jgi:hypothetical protein